MKECAFFIKQDILPGLKSRAFRRRVRIGPHDTRCNRPLADGRTCEEEETLIHFFTCPQIRSTFDELKHIILSFTENENLFPPVTDIQFLLGDFSSSKTKLCTGIWALYVVLHKIYVLKNEDTPVVFESVWNWAKGDIRIANLCRNGKKLDETIFD